MTAEARQWRNTLRWSTNGDFFQTLGSTMGFIPQETSVATLCRILPRQQLNLFTIISSPRKFAECLYCDVSPPPILHVLSRFVEFTYHMQLYSRTVIYSLYSHTNHIHSYIHTITHSYINTFTH